MNSKKLNGFFLHTLAAANLVLMTSACSKHKNQEAPQPPSAAISTPQVRIDGGGSTSENTNTSTLDRAICENPIQLEDSQLTPLIKTEEFPQGTFKVSEIQIYALREATHNSFVASTKESDNFTVKLDCNGIRNIKDDNYSRTYTDDQGVLHEEKLSQSEKLTDDFKVSDTIDTSSAEKATHQRVIKVGFEDGKLVLAESYLAPDSSTGEKPLGQIPLERVQVGEDTYVTVRIYSPSLDKIDLRTKMEFPADENGKRSIKYGRAVYSRI